MNRRFKFTIPECVIRKMNRQQYKVAMRWLRFSARMVHDSINWVAFDKQIQNNILYGYSKINAEDLLK